MDPDSPGSTGAFIVPALSTGYYTFHRNSNKFLAQGLQGSSSILSLHSPRGWMLTHTIFPRTTIGSATGDKVLPSATPHELGTFACVWIAKPSNRAHGYSISTIVAGEIATNPWAQAYTRDA